MRISKKNRRALYQTGSHSASKSGVYNLTRYMATYWAKKRGAGKRVNPVRSVSEILRMLNFRKTTVHGFRLAEWLNRR